MLKTTSQKKEDVESFFKNAFAVDGEATLVTSRSEKRRFKILSIVKLTDSERGEFFIASVTPKS